ncbi:uncharacterized protein [Amphiura filiformis]|uniref:uncharacterized protein n=1 Tax=Amphiura filiformis TaxID=82378 RepID=UPI003B2152CD
MTSDMDIQARYLSHPSRYQPSSMQLEYPTTGYVPKQQYTARYPAQPQVNYLQVQRNHRRNQPQHCPRYNTRAAVAVGILQIISGLLLMSCGSVLIKRKTRFRISWSIWGSLCFYIVTGIIGIISRNRRKRVITAYMAMCALSAGCACAQAIYDTVSGVKSRSEDMAFIYCDYFEYYANRTCYRQRVIMILHLFCAAAGFAEMVICIIGMLVCWSGICGPGSAPTETVGTQTIITCAENTSSRHSTLDRMKSYDDSPSSSLQHYPQDYRNMDATDQRRYPSGYLHQTSFQQSKQHQGRHYEEPISLRL